MYYILTLISGILTAVMIVSNGELTAQFEVYSATVIIHIIGLILITGIALFRGEKPFAKKLPWYLYLGGAIGVAVTIFGNAAFGRISVSAILALNLLGQGIASLIVDQFGFMNMEQHPLKKSKLLGLLIVSYGISFMITDFEIVAVVLSLLSGASLVISRVINGGLAKNTSVVTSTFFNYFIGLVVAVPVMLISFLNEPYMTPVTFSSNVFIYMGGAIGVGTVFLSNVVISKIPAFYMTLFLFVGQVFSGLVLDSILTGEFSIRNLQGAAFVAVGLVMNLLLDKGKINIKKENEFKKITQA